MLPYNQLAVFFNELRASGFTVDPDQRIKVTRLLLHLSTYGGLLENHQQICNQLAAILCTSAEQQEQFKARFIMWFGVRDNASSKPFGKDGLESEKDLESDKRKKQAPANRRNIFSFGRHPVLLVIIAAIIFVLLALLIGFDGYSPHLPAKNISDAAVEQVKDFEEKFGFLLAPLIILPFAMLAIWLASPGRLRDAIARKKKTISKLELLALLLSPHLKQLFAKTGLAREVQVLRRPRETLEPDDIDVKASIDKTVQLAGFRLPVAKYRKVASEYLVLIDRQGKHDHQAKFFDILISLLKNSGVYVNKYYFNGDPRHCYKAPLQPRISIEELAGRHSDDFLLMFANGFSLFNEITGELHGWTKIISKWQPRVLLSPVPAANWEHKEQIIKDKLGLFVLPATSAGIKALAGIFTAGEQQAIKRKPLLKDGPNDEKEDISLLNMLVERPLRWLEESVPSEELVANLLHGLRADLGYGGFDWLVACAACPVINWNLTLHFGANLKDGAGKPLLTEMRLLAISRLPWFREGRMPEWLRLRLLQTLEPEPGIAIHALLDNLVSTISFRGKKNFVLEAAAGERTKSIKQEDIEYVNDRISDDSVLFDFITARPFLPDSFNLSARIAQTLGLPKLGGLFRDMSAGMKALHITNAASRLKEEVDPHAMATIILDTSKEAGNRFGVEFARCTGYKTLKGDIIDFSEPCVIFRHTYEALAKGFYFGKLIDFETAETLRTRRKLSTVFALLTSVIIFMLVYFLYELAVVDLNPLIGVITLFTLMAFPFFVLHRLLVRPILKMMESFPSVPVKNKEDN